MRSLLTLPKFLLLSLLLSFGYSASALAVLMSDLYEVILPVADESSEARNAAMADGLAEMLVRQSGDGHILQKLLPPPAGAYVKQYRYEARQPVDPEDPNARQIRLQYNSTRVMDFLRDNGLPIWGDHRSLAVVWLAVRDGSNQYLLRAGDISVFKTQIDKLLKQRGVPAVWPAYDKQDQAIIKFADVWAGFSEPLKQASARYSQGPVLAGNLVWNGSAWSSDWTLLDQRFSQRWSVRSTDYEQLLSDAINLISDTMGKQYAVLESTDGSAEAQVLLEIENVKSLASFVRVKKYLGSLQAVQNVQMKRVAGEHAVFRLSLRSKIDDFITLLAAGSELRPVSAPEPSTGSAIAPQLGTAGSAGGTEPPEKNAGPVVASNLYHYRLVY
jgi:hypothetical protein